MNRRMLHAAACLGLALGVAGTVFYLPAEASRNASGTYALPAGNPVTTGSTITSSWANTTLSDLGTEVTNSLDRSGRGAMLAPLQLAAGTVSAPALTWSADTASGLYRGGANSYSMSVAGTARQTWTSSGSTLTGTVALPSTTTVTAPSATSLVGGTGWTWTTARYWKTATGTVYVQATGTVATGYSTALFSAALPIGYRPFVGLPASLVRVPTPNAAITHSSAAIVPVELKSDGTFNVNTAALSNGDTIHFHAVYPGESGGS